MAGRDCGLKILAPKKSAQFCREPICIFHFALPNNQDTESKRLQVLKICNVSLNVALQLRTPILKPGFRNVGIDALPMLMPKTATDFNDFVQSWENQIRLSREVRNVESIAESHAMNHTANEHFRRSVG